MELYSPRRRRLLSTLALASFSVPDSVIWGQTSTRTLTAAKLLDALAAQVKMMAGKEITWKQMFATMGGTGTATVTAFQFDGNGQLLNGIAEDWVLKCRSEREFYASKTESTGKLLYEYFGASGDRLAYADHSKKLFLEDQQNCPFRMMAIAFPTWRVLEHEEGHPLDGNKKHDKWTLKKLAPDMVELVLHRRETLMLRAQFALPSLVCLSLEESSNHIQTYSYQALPGGTVEGLPFLPLAYRKTSKDRDVDFVWTSRVNSVKPLDPRTFPPYEAPPGFDSMTQKERHERDQERIRKNIKR